MTTASLTSPFPPDLPAIHVIFAEQFYGLRNIAEGDGLGISLLGISVVFVALIFISLFITGLQHALAMLAPVLPPEVERHRAAAPAAKRTDHDDAVVAAIGFALHAQQRGADVPPSQKP